MSANGKRAATYTAAGMLLASLLGAATARANDWTSLGLDAGRGRATDEKSGAPFSPAWNTNPSAAPFIASPMVVDGLVVVAGSKGDVSALSALDGKEAWTVKAAGAIGASPAVDRGRIVKNEVAASAWVLESFAHQQSIGDDRFQHRSRSLHYVFNCVERTYAVPEWVMYDGTLGHGEIAWANWVGDPAFVRVEDGSREASLLAAACGDSVLANHSYPAPRLN